MKLTTKIIKMTNSNFYNQNIATQISELHDLGLMAFNDTDGTTDVCDSIAFLSKDKSTKVKIFFPNSDITDIEQEMFHTFSIQTFFDENEESCFDCEFNTWNDVLEFLKFNTSFISSSSMK